MLSKEKFLEVVKESFKTYLCVGTSRSTAKLKSLHGNIAKDLKEILGNDFTVKAQGFGNDKEECINGRYYPKNVDIAINYKGKPVAAYAIKFVMRNYSQNSNNYFENMLGETANLRSNLIPYFQIFIIFDKVPYYKKGGEFSHYEEISANNISKYLKLSKDNNEVYFHIPNKTLFILINLEEKKWNYQFNNESEYAEYYLENIDHPNLLKYSNRINCDFGENVIFNDYEDFIRRTSYTILGKVKN